MSLCRPVLIFLLCLHQIIFLQGNIIQEWEWFIKQWLSHWCETCQQYNNKNKTFTKHCWVGYIFRKLYISQLTQTTVDPSQQILHKSRKPFKHCLAKIRWYLYEKIQNWLCNSSLKPSQATRQWDSCDVPANPDLPWDQMTALASTILHVYACFALPHHVLSAQFAKISSARFWTFLLSMVSIPLIFGWF